MNRTKFERLVAKAIEALPEEFSVRLDNVVVVIADRPSRDQLASVGLRRGHDLLGLYEGVPLTERGASYGLVLPDRITIFQRAIESECASDDEIADEIRKTIQHEIAHHFGISDARLDELER